MADSEYESFAEQVLGAYQPDQSPDDALVVADYFTEHGDLPMAASALDRAYGLAPTDASIAARRDELLDELELIEHGLRFRYVPAGSFLMGSDSGDHDERPVHPVRLPGYWMSETPVTWATFSDLLDWTPPPNSVPKNRGRSRYGGMVGHDLRWTHSAIGQPNLDESEQQALAREYGHLRSTVDERYQDKRSLQYDVNPVVAIAKDDAMEMCGKISTGNTTYRLPTEAEWEKAARGGLIGKRFAWGDQPPTPGECDFNRFGEGQILAPKKTFRNGYGLHGVCGGVWEWTLDPYDSQSYHRQQNETTSHKQPSGLIGKLATRVTSIFTPAEHREHTLRGGAWTDCAEAVTVSFRMSRDSVGWESDDYERRRQLTPTIGFRICRVGPMKSESPKKDDREDQPQFNFDP